MFGILNLDKPAGVTSRDVVNVVQRQIRPVKVGHAGTLDPLATGVLVLCVGPATRLIEYVQRMPKSYRGTFLLGQKSDTEDVEGEVVELVDPPRPTEEDLVASLTRYVGTIDQRPPAYSALKVRGKRAYELARQGQEVELAPRPVQIYELRLVSYEYPRFTIDVTCGSGTYIRSLGRDIAESLGTSAVMSELVRTAIGGFRQTDAITPDAVEAKPVEELLLPAALAVAELPRMTLDSGQQQHIANGRTIACDELEQADEIAAFDSSGNLLALLRPRGPGQLGALRNFNAGG